MFEWSQSLSETQAAFVFVAVVAIGFLVAVVVVGNEGVVVGKTEVSTPGKH